MQESRLGRALRTLAALLTASLIATLAAFGVLLSQGQGAIASASQSASDAFGVYAGPASPSTVSSLGQAIGHQPRFAMDFLDGTSWQTIDDPSWFMSQWQGSGYSMIWGVPILPNDTDYSLATGATGAYNQYFVTLAQAFVAGGQGSSVIRLGWEFNGGWFPWAANGQEANFISYWQQIVNAMRSVPGANFKFEWNPTLGDQGVGNLASYYPGNAYVDYIGADVYDEAWATYPGAAAEFQQIETETYGLNWLAGFAAQQGKPITLPEWGLGWGDNANGGPVSDPGANVSGGDDPVFINDMASWIAANNVYEATFWDYGSSIVNASSNPNSYAAIISDFASPTTTTPTTAPTTTTTTSPPATTATLSESQTSAKYGSEYPTAFTVTVVPALSGTATILNGTSTLCTAVVTNGSGSCTLSNNELSVGNYQVGAQFADSGMTTSTSDVAYSVVPRTTVTTMTVVPTPQSRRTPASYSFSASVRAVTGGIPIGTVMVKTTSGTLCTISLGNGTGTCSSKAKGLKRGTYAVTATYGGDAWDAISAGSATLKVS